MCYLVGRNGGGNSERRRTRPAAGHAAAKVRKSRRCYRRAGKRHRDKKGKKVERRREPSGLRPIAPSPGSPWTCRSRTWTGPSTTWCPERLGAQARPGVRVRVRFAGQLTDGFILDRVDSSEHQGRLSYLERVVSAEQVLTPEIAGLARAVADRYAGTLADVLRLAIPQRHAATETGKTPVKTTDRAPGSPPDPARARTLVKSRGGGLPPRPEPGPWARYPAGPAFLDAVAAGRPARAAWTALPGPTWPEEIARAALTAASAGRGAVIVVPDARDLARVDEALATLSPEPDGHVTLTADLGPAERYRRWLRARRGAGADRRGHPGGHVRPGAEPGPGGALGRRRRPARRAARPLPQRPGGARAPRPPGRRRRPHRRVRPHRRAGAARAGRLGQGPDPGPGHAPRHRRAGAARRRRAGTRPRRGGDHGPAARPGAAHRPRRARSRRPGPRPGAAARLPRLGRLRPLPGPGPVRRPDRGSAVQRPAPAARASTPRRTAAGAARSRPAGAARIAATTGSARSSSAPPAPPRNSAGPSPASRSARPAATWCCRGFPTSPRWSSPRPAPSRWRGRGRVTPPPCCSTAGRCSAGRVCARGRRRSAAGSPPPPWSGPDGTVLVHADQSLAATQALIRWDPVTFAERELAERAELGFPPAVRMAAVTGEAAAVASLLAGTDPAFEVLGPVPVEQAGPEQARKRRPATRSAPWSGRPGRAARSWPARWRPRRRGAAPARRAAACGCSSIRLS